MNKSKKNKNVTSIAIKLNAISVRDLFLKFLILNACLMFILIVLWCMDSEKRFFGEVVQNAQRHVDFYPIETATYTVTLYNGKTLVQSASEFLYVLRKIIIILGIIEAIFLLEEIIFGTAKVRKRLKPLNDIAETASRLSNMDFSEEKFQGLEDAIAKISPVSTDERIHMGDSEL